MEATGPHAVPPVVADAAPALVVLCVEPAHTRVVLVGGATRIPLMLCWTTLLRPDTVSGT